MLLLSSCQSENKTTENENGKFAEMTQIYQETYMEGGENCEKILLAMDEKIQFSENGKSRGFADLEKFCPHLPKKNVVTTFSDQKLINSNVGYDFVSQLYVNIKGDTIRETASRIWEKSNDTWKIIQMNNSLNRKAK